MMQMVKVGFGSYVFMIRHLLFVLKCSLLPILAYVFIEGIELLTRFMFLTRTVYGGSISANNLGLWFWGAIELVLTFKILVFTSICYQILVKTRDPRTPADFRFKMPGRFFLWVAITYAVFLLPVIPAVIYFTYQINLLTMDLVHDGSILLLAVFAGMFLMSRVAIKLPTIVYSEPLAHSNRWLQSLKLTIALFMGLFPILAYWFWGIMLELITISVHLNTSGPEELGEAVFDFLIDWPFSSSLCALLAAILFSCVVSLHHDRIHRQETMKIPTVFG